MKKQTRLLLWVSNMSVVGADDDYTADYLRAAGAQQIAAKHGVELNEQTLSSDDAERLWRAFRALSVAVAVAGHGGDTRSAPAPILTAKLPDAADSAASLQEVISTTATSYAAWAKEAILGSRGQ